MEPIIQIENLHKRFGKTEAVRGLSLTVPAGGVLAFLGPNGAGKTTTIKTMLNMLPPDSGQVRLFGQDSTRLKPEVFCDIGYVSENQQLPEWMTVQQFMDYCAPMYPNWDAEFAAKLLADFDLPPDRKLKQLSRGMKMKAALLCSLAYRPKLVVLDEPFSGLDPLVRDEFLRGLLELTETEGWTVFISSHDIDEVERLCDSIAIIDAGQLRLHESVEELQARFRSITASADAEFATVVTPEGWHSLEVSGRSLRATVANFVNEDGIRETLAEFADVTSLSCEPMTLREIFISLARTYRLEAQA
ncbi:MAG: ABC-2 type transport system ATP-binding protein [Rhodothermales bacterium]|jgi:ABC-2 type transport system ATP-binding protein